MKRKFNIELPMFPGFYESYFENSDTEYYAIKEEVEYRTNDCGEECTEDDFEFDYKSYERDICEAFAEVFFNMAPKCVVSVEFSKMTSPREYNFSTDRVFADIKLVPDWQRQMKCWINEHLEWFKDRIKRDWTSYDGFISFIDNELEGWKENLFKKMDERYISIMLGYMMFAEDRNIREHLEDATMEGIYVGEYVIDKRQKSNETRA